MIKIYGANVDMDDFVVLRVFRDRLVSQKNNSFVICKYLYEIYGYTNRYVIITSNVIRKKGQFLTPVMQEPYVRLSFISYFKRRL